MAHHAHFQEHIPMKSMVLGSSVSLPSRFSADDDDYRPLPTAQLSDHARAELEWRDQQLKQRIRVLKFISRLLATILSAATLVPQIMTLVKFFQTRNVYYTVNGQERTAWAHDTIAWYTYMYAAVSAVSFLFNGAVCLAYCRGVREANKAASVQSAWSWIVTIGHLVVWCVSVAIYRYGKEPVNGKFRDLWGWTCSQDADALQAVLTDVDFEKYCGMQTSSFYSGAANAGAALLSAIILFLAMRRRRSKKRLQQKMVSETDREPLRV